MRYFCPCHGRRISSVLVFLWVAFTNHAGAQVLADFTFSPTDPVAGTPVQFTDTSTGGPTAWLWNFEDPPNGSDSAAQNPTWTFAAPGSYSVTLTAVDPPLDIDEITKVVVVGEPPPLFSDGFEAGDTCAWTVEVPGPQICGQPGELRFVQSEVVVSESVGVASIQVQRINGSAGSVSVDCITSNGTANAGSDYTDTIDLLTWADGDTANRTCTIPINNDAIGESNETINLSLVNPTGGATLGTPNTAVLTIFDDDSTPTVEFTTTAQTVDEEVGIVTITTQLSAISGLDVEVPLNVGGTATNSVDYTVSPMTITIPAGTTSGSTILTLVDDALDETDETVVLTFGTVVNATSGTTTTQTVTIKDNDGLPTVEFTTAAQTVDESAGSTTVSVALSIASSLDVEIPLSFGGTATGIDDYTSSDTSITIPAGMTSGSVTLTVVDDALDEEDETVVLTFGVLVNATNGATTVQTVTITDNEGNERGELSFVVSTFSVDESVGTASIEVQRINGNDGAVSVRCDTSDGTATAGADYTTTNDTLSWADGDTADKTCTIPIIDDDMGEADETVNLSLGNVTGGATLGIPNTATLAIEDNDSTRETNPTLIFSDGLETGDTCQWGQEIPDVRNCAIVLDNAVLRILEGAALTCGEVPEGMTEGSIRVRIPADEMVRVRLRRDGAVIVNHDIGLLASEVLEISALELGGAFDLEVVGEDGVITPLSVDLYTAALCAELQVLP